MSRSGLTCSFKDQKLMLKMQYVTPRHDETCEGVGCAFTRQH
jgi:hypothetical protein